MSPERITSNIFNILPTEQIPAHAGDLNPVLLSDLKEVRVEFYGPDDDRVQTKEGKIYYVPSGIFDENAPCTNIQTE